MSKSIYIGYITYIVNNKLRFSTPWGKIRDMIVKNLGTDEISKAKLSKLKSLAFKLYYADRASMLGCIGIFSLVKSDMNEDDLLKYIRKSKNFRKANNIGSIDVAFYTDKSKIEDHMESLKDTGLQSFIDKAAPVPVKKAPAKKAPLQKKKPAKVVSRKAPKKELIKKPPQRMVTPPKDLNKMKIIDLKKLATEKGIKGRGSMNKQALIDALAKTMKSTVNTKTRKTHSGVTQRQPSKYKTIEEMRAAADKVHKQKLLSSPPAQPSRKTKKTRLRPMSEYTLKELRDMAAKRKLKGRSTMKKADLYRELARM